MRPPPRGAPGRAVAWKPAALAAHTQTFVTVSRTFYSSSFLARARPGAQVRGCSHRHPQPRAQGAHEGPGAPGGREGGPCRRDRGGRRPRRGRRCSAGGPAPAREDPDAGMILSVALFLSVSLTRNEPQSFFLRPNTGNISFWNRGWCPQRSGQSRASGGAGPGQGTGAVPPTEQVLIGPCAGGPERGLAGPRGTGWGIEPHPAKPPLWGQGVEGLRAKHWRGGGGADQSGLRSRLCPLDEPFLCASVSP